MDTDVELSKVEVVQFKSFNLSNFNFIDYKNATVIIYDNRMWNVCTIDYFPGFSLYFGYADESIALFVVIAQTCG